MSAAAVKREPDRDPFEDAERARKVLALLLAVPPAVTAAETVALAAAYAAMSPAQRLAHARKAGRAGKRGDRVPSDETWALLVDAISKRVPVESLGDPFARFEDNGGPS